MHIDVLFVWNEAPSSRVIGYEEYRAPIQAVATVHSVQSLQLLLLLLL